MSGKFSRDKGARNERALVHYLNALEYEYTAYRVPLSGAMAHYKSDVIAEKNGLKTEFELKTRKKDFTLVYELLGFLKKKDAAGIVTPKNKLIAVSDYWPPKPADSVYLPFSEDNRVIKHLLKYEKWLGKADYLVLKDDYKPFIFIRYVR